MSTNRYYSVAIGMGRLPTMAERIGRVTGEALVTLQINAVNETLETVDETSLEDMSATINLTRPYIKEKMRAIPASKTSPSAHLIASGELTPLGRFPNVQRVQGVTWTNEAIEALGHKFGKWPGWTYRTGDSSRGIEENMKSAGRGVSVKNNTNKTLPGAYTVPLRNAGGTGLFVRHKGDKSKFGSHLYGPSVYSLFRNYLDRDIDKIEGVLMDRFDTFLDDFIEKQL